MPPEEVSSIYIVRENGDSTILHEGSDRTAAIDFAQNHFNDGPPVFTVKVERITRELTLERL